jgi:Asp/Glu/hydantoin racemase
MTTKIGLIHSVIPAIAAVEAAFAEIWPDAQPVSLYDESLYIDLAPDRSLTPPIYERMERLLAYSTDSGANAILVTGSLFGPAVLEGKKGLNIPVLTSFDGLIDEALATGSSFAAVATDPGTNRMLRAELERCAAEAGKTISLSETHVPDATALLNAGDRAAHDTLVVEAAEAAGSCDAILLGQFSMGPTRLLVEQRTGRPTLGAPEAAVRKLRHMFEA